MPKLIPIMPRLPSRPAAPTFVLFGSLVAVIGCSEVPPPDVETWPAPTQDWVEVWRDDFDGAKDSAPDPSRWNVEVRPMGQNEELGYDTNDRKNSFLDGSGNLVLQIIKEQYVDENGVQSSQPYTTARLNTQGKMAQAYGKFEARIKLPIGGRGIWPAFWLLGDDIDVVGWPECGEVDILEWRGSHPDSVIGSLHGPGYSKGNSYNGHHELPGTSYSDSFHVFTLEWTAEAIRWSIDGEPFFVKTKQAISRNGTWVYDHPFFILLNLTVGSGLFDGPPDASTVFPQQMTIDYVSVSQLAPGP